MKNSVIKKLTILHFLFLIGITNAIAQTNYYIDPVNGNDDNVGGTLASPWKSFKNIITYYQQSYQPAQWQELNPGDTIYLMDGVHNTITNPGGSGGATEGGSYIGYFRFKDGDANNWFTIIAHPGANPILDPQGSGVGLWVYQSSYWDISGMTIRNSYAASESGGIALIEISNVKVYNLEVHDTDGVDNNNMAGLHCKGCYDVEIYNSSFHDNYDRTNADTGGQSTTNSGQMVFFRGGNISVHDNEFYNSIPITDALGGTGIKYKHASADPNAYFKVYNNTFKNLKHSAFMTGTANTHFHHNIIIDSGGIDSRDLAGPTHQVNQIFEYNTIYSSVDWRTKGILVNPTTNWRDADFPDDPKNVVIRNNIIYDIRPSYGGENGIIDIGTYMNDDLYNAIYPELTIENNCYYNPNIPVKLNIGAANNGGSYGVLGDAYSLTGWQQDLGFDINSVEADPMFENIANEQFQLISGSPCANMGAYATENNTFTCADAPAGTFFCDDYETTAPLSDRYFEASSTNFQPTDGVGRGGSRGLRAVFDVGTVNAGSIKKSFGRTPSSYIGNHAVNPTQDYDEIYWRIDVRTQPGWQGGGGSKLSRATTFAASDWSQGMIAHLWSDGPSGRLTMDPASGIDTDGNLATTGYNDFPNLRWLGSKTSDLDLFSTANSGTWFCIEAHVKLNTPGMNDGIFEFWIDGDLQRGSYDLNWHDTWNNDPANFKINAILIENYWNAGSPVAQERYMDNFIISTSPIGCNASSSDLIFTNGFE